jgi:hypothetical protein
MNMRGLGVDVQRPLLFRLPSGLDRCAAVGIKVADAIGHPVDMVLDRDHHDGNGRRAARPRHIEKIGESGNRHPR